MGFGELGSAPSSYLIHNDAHGKCIIFFFFLEKKKKIFQSKKKSEGELLLF